MRWYDRCGLLALAGFTQGMLATPVQAALGEVRDDGVSIWRVLAALLLCLALAVAGAFALRARGGSAPRLRGLGGGTRRLHLQERLRISPQVQLCIIACDGREMLIATSATGAQLVAEVGTSRA